MLHRVTHKLLFYFFVTREEDEKNFCYCKNLAANCLVYTREFRNVGRRGISMKCYLWPKLLPCSPPVNSLFASSGRIYAPRVRLVAHYAIANWPSRYYQPSRPSNQVNWMAIKIAMYRWTIDWRHGGWKPDIYRPVTGLRRIR